MPNIRRKSKKSFPTHWAERAQQVRHALVKATHRTKRLRKVKMLSIVTTLVFIGLLLFTVTGVSAIVFFSKDLPSPHKLTEREVPQTTKMYSRQGDLLYEIFDEQQRTFIELKDIPQHLKDATLAAEDSDFYHHSGFDVAGILRSAYRIVTQGRIAGGGSTITQQLVKNVFLSPEQTLTRKLKEIIMALRIESTYSKDEILQMYFNEVGYGGNYYGVGAAAEGFFGKHVRDLTLEEAVFLAGLPQSPTLYNPRSGDPELSRARFELVLDLMVKDKLVTQEEADLAKASDVIERIRPLENNIQAPHFVFYVKQELVNQFGEKLVEQGGLRVTTTLDMGKQRIAEEEIRYQLERLANQNAQVNNQALVAVNPQTGEIVTMVGSADYFNEEIDGNVNVILADRQPGSAIKPIMYVKALQMGYTTATFLPDIYACFGKGADGKDYCPSNSDGKYWGPLLLREALANSRNTPAVRMAQLIGVDNIIQQAEELGITTLTERDRYGLSLALGAAEVKPLELTKAYSAFWNGGEQHDLISILKVEDSNGNVIFENKTDQRKPRRVIPDDYAFLITDILSDEESRARLFGANNLLEIGRPAAVKTGTTNDNRDAWTCGGTPTLGACVWTGNTDNSPMASSIQGSTGATPTWHHFMKRSLEGQAIEQFKRPNSITKVVVDRLSGKLPQGGSSFATRHEVFAQSTIPTEIDDFHQVVEICQSKGLIATDYHKLIGDVEQKVYTFIKEPNSALQQYSDEWMSQHSGDGYGKPPTELCPIVDSDGDPLSGPYVKITEPEDDQELSDTTFTVKAEAYSEHRIIKVEFYWDDTLVKTVTSTPYEATYSVSEDVEDKHNIKVIAYDGKGDAMDDEINVEFPNQGGVIGITDPPLPGITPTPTPTGGTKPPKPRPTFIMPPVEWETN